MRDVDKKPAAVFSWSDSLDAIDWHEVETLCRLAPLGNHQGHGLGKQVVARLVAMSRRHKKIGIADPSTS